MNFSNMDIKDFEELLKNRLPNMYMANHGRSMDAESMDKILKKAQSLDFFCSLEKGEQKSNDE